MSPPAMPACGIAVIEVPTALLPDGRYWKLVPATLTGTGRPVIVTSDPERLAREIAEESERRGKDGVRL